jgi:hypothetical protein
VRCYIDLDTQGLVSGLGTRTPITSLPFKRGDSSRIELLFFRGITQTELAAGATAVFGLKEKGKYDGEYVVLAGEWAKEGEGATALYVFTPNFNTVALNTLLASGDLDDENDVASIELMGEIEWQIDGQIYSTQTFAAIVANDVNKGNEGTPQTNPTPDNWLDARAVRYDKAQALTESQGAQAAANIGVPKFHSVTEHPQFAPEVIGSGSTSPVEANDSFPRVSATHYGTISAEPGFYWVTGGQSYWAFRDSNIGTERWKSPDAGAAVAIPSPASPDLVELWTAANGSTGALVVKRVPTVKTGDIAEVEDGPLYRKTDDGWIELLEAIDPATNATDDAGLTRINGKQTLVLRHQTDSTWHTFKVVDSIASPGDPTYEISAAL